MAYTTIKKPSSYFNTKLYTGNGSTQSITGVNFQPDLVWLKGRSVVAGHNLHDVVRGVNKQLYTNTTGAEETLTTLVTSFDSDGFSLGSNGNANSNTNTFVSWNWLASNTTASNTDGSITSTVSANTTSGFSIVSYAGNSTAGATVGHGLGVKPSVIIIKGRSGQNWCSYHSTLGATKFLRLNSTNASATRTESFNDTEPTSSVFSLGTDGETNLNTETYIAYCFAEKQGFSKFGSWTGADGAFIYTGFKPAFILGKNASNTAGYDWWTFDNKRDSFNDGANNLLLRPNASDAEQTITFAPIDFLSNGFKIYGTDNTVNGSGNTMIYMAFAEEPLVGDNPCTAR